MQLAGDGIRKKFLRNARRKGVGHGGHALHIGQILDLVGHLLLRHRGGVGEQGQHHVAAPEFLHDHLVVRVYLRALAGAHRAVSVEEIVHSLGHIGHRGDEQHDGGNDVAHPVNPAAELVKLRKKRTVFGAFIPFGKFQDHGRHEEQHSQQAEHDSLCQHQAHVKADGEVHEHQG